LIGPLHHAHLSEAEATSSAATASHAAGNRGVEHAPPRAILGALEAAVSSFGASRRQFDPEWAQGVGLSSAFDAGEEGRGSGERRRALCARLGLGRCTGAQLLAALNRYFSLEQVEEALEEVEGAQAQAGASR
jgi:hypothetical protein